MKFRFLLWAMGLLMARASRNNPAFQQQLKGKDLVFQMQTLDGKVARHFIVSNERVSSKSGSIGHPCAISDKPPPAHRHRTGCGPHTRCRPG